MAARTVLLFTRSPAAETRAKGLPVRAGSDLFASFLRGWCRTAAEAGVHLMVVAPRGSVASLRRMLPDVDVEPQPDDRFEVKLDAAFDLAFRHSAGAVFMVGGDSPRSSPLRFAARSTTSSATNAPSSSRPLTTAV